MPIESYLCAERGTKVVPPSWARIGKYFRGPPTYIIAGTLSRRNEGGHDVHSGAGGFGGDGAAYLLEDEWTAVSPGTNPGLHNSSTPSSYGRRSRDFDLIARKKRINIKILQRKQDGNKQQPQHPAFQWR